MPFKPTGPLAMTLQGAHVAIEDGTGVDGLTLSKELVCYEVIQNGAGTAPVIDPDSTVDAADIVEFRYSVVEEEFIVDGAFDASAVVLGIITSFKFVVVSKLRDAVSDEDPNPTAVVVDDELILKGNFDVLSVPSWSVTKLVVLEPVSSIKLDVVPKLEGKPSDEATEDPNPAAVVSVVVDDELTPRDDVLMLPYCSVTKLLVLELVC